MRLQADGEADGEINPPFRLVMTFRSRLVGADGTKLDEWTVESKSGGYKFVKWADNDAAVLREEAASAARKMGATIACRVHLHIGLCRSPDPL
jgi:hypothetical protein